MSRLLAVFVTVLFVIQSGSANAQRRRHRSNYPSSGVGFSIGVGSYPGFGYPGFGYPGFGYLDPYRFDGYGYDPYRYGNFRPYDPMQDPYYRERYRYDSFFPGRRHAQRNARPIASAAFYDPYRSATNPAAPNLGAPNLVAPVQLEGAPIEEVPLAEADLAERLRLSSGQLALSLSAHPNGDGWKSYLTPDQISHWIAGGNLTQLRELLTHYDGVVANPQLTAVAAVSGFEATRRLLREYVSQ